MSPAAGRHRDSVHGNRCAGGCGRDRVTYPVYVAGSYRPIRIIRQRTCGAYDCEVLADLEDDLSEEGDR